MLFCDFGPEFRVIDPDGEEPTSCMLACIAQDPAGTVTCLEGERHGLSDGDMVRFSQVEGMEGLCEEGPFEAAVRVRVRVRVSGGAQGGRFRRRHPALGTLTLLGM